MTGCLRSLRSPLVWLGLWASAGAAADYLAYAVGEQSRIPLPESLEGVDARYLLELDWTYRGGRSTIEVLPVEDATGLAGADSGAGVPVDAIRTVVAEALRRTGRFDVDSGGTTAGEEPRDVTDHVLQIAVAAYGAEAAARVTNPRAGGARQPQTGQGRVGLRFRLVDAAGTLLLAERFEAVIEQPRAAFVGHPAIEGLPADSWRAPVGQALLAAVASGTYRMVRTLGPLPVSGQVVKAEENRVWLNLGAGNVAVGDRLVVAAEGEMLVDPETGLSLGGAATELARLRVVEVEPRFSVAETLSATGAPARGDRVTPTARPMEFEFAPRWTAPAPGEF